jgi:2-oxoglutarate/2-oxoacid ferredoxin oxidoreductase subunit alpha
MKLNDWSLKIATSNGSGSQSANLILVKSLFRMGIPVGGKNLFPSNIQGLPTWFTIRTHPKGFVGRQAQNNLVVSMNPQTVLQDEASVLSGGWHLVADEALPKIAPRPDIRRFLIPFRELSKDTSSSIRLRKLLANVVYVGIVARLLKMDRSVVEETLHDHFKGKDSVIESNLKAFAIGWNYAETHLPVAEFPLRAAAIKDGNQGKILIDGNSSAALGLLFGGCTFMSWYPITPSSSLAESFESYALQYRSDDQDRHRFAVIQAEDELSAINMVLGAGWAGARAVTTTSGPGLSLMAEAAGLSYFAEVPAVIWDVQRAGPSTGLPTRTMQGDVLAAQKLSHGDTQHVLLFPAKPEECFEFGRTALDLAERLQTLIVVLSDLDLGMNLWIADEFQENEKPFDRGKVLSAEGLNHVDSFARYADVDGDGIPYRTLPGTHHTKAGYFARGTGHTETAGYSEDSDNYARILTRLKKKMDTARGLVPPPVLTQSQPSASRTLLIAYGSTDFIIPEVQELLSQRGLQSDYLRLRAWPLSPETATTISNYDRVFLIEQNRDGQMRDLLRSEGSTAMTSILSFDGLPISAQAVANDICVHLGKEPL